MRAYITATLPLQSLQRLRLSLPPPHLCAHRAVALLTRTKVATTIDTTIVATTVVGTVNGIAFVKAGV